MTTQAPWPPDGESRFPRSLEDLTDTGRCPACFTPLVSPVCGACGLDLRHPAAYELLAVSQQSAEALAARAGVIAHIRAETRATATSTMPAKAATPTVPASLTPSPSTTPPAPAASAPNADSTVAPTVSLHDPTATASPVPAAVSTGAPTAAPRSTATPAASAESVAEQPQPGRSGVQLVLLIAGVSLLSVAAIFFLVYAFFTYGIVWQSVIVGGLTLASIAVAQLLAHRRLRATGEGIAVFGTVLVLLDVWAIRQNDLFGTRSMDANLYAGIGLLTAVAVLWLWHGFGRLRAPGLAASALLIPSLALLVAGIAEFGDQPLEVTLVFGVAALGGIAQRMLRHRVDGAIVAGSAAASLLVAAISSIVVGGQDAWGAAGAMVAVALAGAILTISFATSRSRGGEQTRPLPAETKVFAGIVAGIGGATLAAVIAVVVTRMPQADELLAWPLLTAVAVAAALELGSLRSGRGLHRMLLATAALGAAITTAIVEIAPLGVLLSNAAVSGGIAVQRAWWMTPTSSLGSPVSAEPLVAAALGFWGALLVIALAWLAGRVLVARRTTLAWVAAVLLPLTALIVGVVWLTVALQLLIAAAAVTTLLVSRSRSLPWRLRAPLLFLALSAGFIAGAIGWASTVTWAIAAAALAVLLIAARGLIPPTGARAVPMAVAASMLIGLVALAPLALTGRPLGSMLPYDSLLALLVLAAVMVATGAAPSGRLLPADRHTLFWIAGALVVAVTLRISAAGPLGTVLIDARLGDLVSSALLLAAIALWLWSPLTRALRSTRIVAAAATGPVFAALLNATLYAAPEVVRAAIPGAAAVLVTLAALVVTAQRDAPPKAPAFAEGDAVSSVRRLPRWAADSGALATGSITLLSSITARSDSGWLGALLLAAALFIASVGPGRPFGFGPPRGLLVWPAIAVATGALWSRLGDGGITALELYLVPPSLALLAVALRLDRVRRRDASAAGVLGRAAAAAVLIGLLLTLVPLGVVSAGGAEPIRLPIVAAISIGLLIAAAALRSPRWQTIIDAVAFAGAIATLVAVGGRALVAADRTPQLLSADGWCAVLVTTFIVAAILIVRPAPGERDALRSRMAQALLGTAILAIVVIETLATGANGIGGTRALLVVLLLAALHVLATTVDVAPFTRTVGWLAIAGAAVFAVAMLVADRAEPIETVTVPIALALLATGAIRMLHDPAARSWPWLGPGIAIALVPTLIATAWAPPLWRLVALGIAAVAAAVVGAVLRLQAPFLLGAAVAIVHGVATFMPQLRAVYEAVEWWLWLGIGGAILVALAVRYERRLRDAREAVRRIGSMR